VSELLTEKKEVAKEHAQALRRLHTSLAALTKKPAEDAKERNVQHVDIR
jgi:hypothetical protein